MENLTQKIEIIENCNILEKTIKVELLKLWKQINGLPEYYSLNSKETSTWHNWYRNHPIFESFFALEESINDE